MKYSSIFIINETNFIFTCCRCSSKEWEENKIKQAAISAEQDALSAEPTALSVEPTALSAEPTPLSAEQAAPSAEQIDHEMEPEQEKFQNKKELTNDVMNDECERVNESIGLLDEQRTDSNKYRTEDEIFTFEESS